MVTISLCMIVKNEEDVLARCLDGAKEFADEIIIVDTGSLDKTKEIAKEYTDLIFDFEWIDDFAAARNFAFSKATKDYCMWLDADDVIMPGDRVALLELKTELSSDTDIVMMKYNTGFDTDGNVTFSYFRERLIRNHKGYLWEGIVHEVIAPAGEIKYSDIAISHSKVHPSDSERNLRIFENFIKKGGELDLRQQFYYGRELYYAGKYEEAIVIMTQFLDSDGGWIENKIEACKQLSYCFSAINQERAALLMLLRSLEFDSPRAELCCEIGKYFFERENYRIAAFWYQTALGRTRNDASGGFVIPDCYDYLPAIQLCVCYDRLGNAALAMQFNELAGKVKPNSPAYLHNAAYFKSKTVS